MALKADWFRATHRSSTILIYGLVHDEFVIAAQTLSERLEVYHQASQEVTGAKRAIESIKASNIRAGVEERNQAERDANLALLIEGPQSELAKLERELDDARHDLEQARLKWDLLRYRLRLLEVEARPYPVRGISSPEVAA